MGASLYPRLVLASASPRRAVLLELLGIPHDVMPSGIEENLGGGADVEAEVERVARAKALSVSSSGMVSSEHRAVVAADTAVIVDGEALGKPADASDAAGMLRRLSGRMHRVATGVAVVWLDVSPDDPERVESWTTVTDVEFRALREEEIGQYVRSGRPLDKAGAYGIQEDAAAFVTRIDGCYFNVVGLPLARLCERLLERCHRDG